MQIPFSPLVVLLLAVMAQALFAAGLLWTGRQNRVSNRFLALLMLAITLWLLDGFLRVSGLYRQNAELYFSPIYYSLAFGPLLYFYVRSLVNHEFRWRARYGWHFGPVLLQAGLYWWLRFQPYGLRNWFWQHVHQPYTYRLEFVGTLVSLLLYLFLSLRRLRHYRRWLVDNFSEVSELRLRWLRWLLLLLLAVVSGQWLVEVVLREYAGLYYQYDYSTELLGLVAFIIGVVGLQQADMRAVQFEEEAAEPLGESPAPVAAPAAAVVASAAAEESGPAVPGESILLPVELASKEAGPAAIPARPVDEAVAARIRRALEVDQLYLNPTLTLAELAARTGLAPKLISYTINQGFGCSFNDLVNGLRVAEVQRRLAAPDARRLTLLGIALESGFNSKTTFNRIFRQFTGLAPRDYRPE